MTCVHEIHNEARVWTEGAVGVLRLESSPVRKDGEVHANHGDQQDFFALLVRFCSVTTDHRTKTHVWGPKDYDGGREQDGIVQA